MAARRPAAPPRSPVRRGALHAPAQRGEPADAAPHQRRPSAARPHPRRPAPAVPPAAARLPGKPRPRTDPRRTEAVMTARRWFQQYVRETDFLHRYPFYAGVLAQLEFEATTQVPVMGMRWRDGDYCLLVNEAFFARRPRFRAGVLLHEVHHLVLGHLVRRAFFDVAHADLMQLAMETSANEYIAEALPAPIVWQQFRHAGLGPHQTTQHRYELLVAGRDRIDARTLQQVSRFDDHGGRGDGLGIGIQDLLRGRALPGAAAAKLHVVLRRARSIGRAVHKAVVSAGTDLPPRPLRA